MNIKLRPGYWVDVELKIQPANAKVDGKLNWSVIDSAPTDPEAEYDGTVIVKASPETGIVGRIIVPKDAVPSTEVVRVTGDADLGEGVSELIFDIEVEIESPTAENLEASTVSEPVAFDNIDDVDFPAEPTPPATEPPQAEITAQVKRSGKV